MKNSQLLIILGVVILAHLLFIFAIKPSRKKAPVEQQAVAEEPVVSQPEIVEPVPVPPVPQEEKKAGVQKYSSDYFTTSLGQLTPLLNSMAQDCKAGVAVDLSSHTIRWGKNMNVGCNIASITKMMTALLVVENMRASNGAITMETPIKVSDAASKIGGRQVWLSPKETFTLEELFKAMLVHSANDCAYLLAEFSAGSETAFVERMNKRAAELGCSSFKFINSHGLPDSGRENVASAVELAYLADVLLEIPEITRWSGVKTSYFRERDEAFIKKNSSATMLSSSNSLLGTCKGVNGLKTGYTKKAGFSIVVTCEREGRKTAVVLLGFNNAKSRDKMAAALVEWLYTIK